MSACATEVRRSRRRLSNTTIRLDFEKQALWTLAEAGEFAGVGPQAVRRWMKTSVAGKDGRLQHRWKPGNRVGPLVVDAVSFQLYIQSGEPQGELA